MKKCEIPQSGHVSNRDSGHLEKVRPEIPVAPARAGFGLIWQTGIRLPLDPANSGCPVKNWAQSALGASIYILPLSRVCSCFGPDRPAMAAA